MQSRRFQRVAQIGGRPYRIKKVGTCEYEPGPGSLFHYPSHLQITKTVFQIAIQLSTDRAAVNLAPHDRLAVAVDKVHATGLLAFKMCAVNKVQVILVQAKGEVRDVDVTLPKPQLSIRDVLQFDIAACEVAMIVEPYMLQPIFFMSKEAHDALFIRNYPVTLTDRALSVKRVVRRPHVAVEDTIRRHQHMAFIRQMNRLLKYNKRFITVSADSLRNIEQTSRIVVLD